MTLQAFRCWQCNLKLAEYRIEAGSRLEIKCPKCRAMNKVDRLPLTRENVPA